jgi:hypothetical protein
MRIYDDEFTQDDAAELAQLVFRRFRCDQQAATEAWRRLMQNNCSEEAFMSLVHYEPPPEPVRPPVPLRSV